MRELARQLIEENLRTKNPVLDLGNCGLDGTEEELYKALADADHLEKLIFSNVWFEYDEGKKKWEERKSENPGHKNVLIKIPVSLPKNLTTLIATIESKNGEVQDYTFLKKFIHLKKLYLHDNQITDISFLESLTQLQSLYLYTAQLRSINLKDLKKLEFLELNWGSIQEISLEGFEKLKYLGMDHTALRSIYLKNLPNLQNINLLNLSLENVVLQNLPQLQNLHLIKNRIRNIPNLKNLPQLHSLHLSSNHIEDITFLKDLPQLQLLTLRHNNIKEISLEFLNSLPSLNSLHLFENPIKNIPKEIYNTLDNALPDVRIYLESLKKEGYLQEAKMILIGNPEVGKSSIRLKLIDKNASLPTKEDRTPGIDLAVEAYKIKNLLPEITGLDNAIDFDFHIWDFGGQGKYREIQQLFCSRKSLYLFVTACDDNPAKEDYAGFEYWLSMANAFNYDKETKKHSPVIHVLNKIDKPISPTDEKEIREVFPNIHADFIKISCETLENFNLLENAIKKVLPLVSEDIFTTRFSSTWLSIKYLLERKHLNGETHIHYGAYLIICMEHQIEQSEANLLLRTLDRMGYLIYYGNNPKLKDWIILNPLWVKDAIYKVLDSPIIRDLKFYFEYFPLIWKEYVVPSLWNKKKDQKPMSKKYSSEEHQKLLALMLAYEFCYEQQDNHGETYYIIPALFGEKPPIPETLQSFDYNIKFVYAPFIPAGTLNKLIVRLHKDIYQDFKWKNGVILHDLNHLSFAEVTEVWQEKTVYLKLKGENIHSLYQLIFQTLKDLNQDLKETKFLAKLDFEIEALYEEEWIKAQLVNLLKIKKYSFINGFENIDDSIMKKDKVFVSYSHMDNEKLKRVQVHLKVLKNEGIVVDFWDDTRIKGGMKWRDEIEKALAVTKVAILLISTDFLASDFITKYELPSLLKAAEDEGATILPLILKPCRLTKHKKLGEFQAVNDPSKPLSSLSEHEQDEILVKLMDRIEELMDENE